MLPSAAWTPSLEVCLLGWGRLHCVAPSAAACGWHTLREGLHSCWGPLSPPGLLRRPPQPAYRCPAALVAGTYFPPSDSFGRPGFKTVLRRIAQARSRGVQVDGCWGRVWLCRPPRARHVLTAQPWVPACSLHGVLLHEAWLQGKPRRPPWRCSITSYFPCRCGRRRRRTSAPPARAPWPSWPRCWRQRWVHIAPVVVLQFVLQCWPAAGGRLASLLLACLAACCFLGADWPALVCPSTPWGSRPPRR